MTIDLGYGALTSGSPLNTILALRCMGLSYAPQTIAGMREFIDGSVDRPSSKTIRIWAARLWATQFPNTTAGMTRLSAFESFWAADELWIRSDAPLYVAKHSASWTQVVSPETRPTMVFKNGLVAISMNLREVSPV